MNKNCTKLIHIKKKVILPLLILTVLAYFAFILGIAFFADFMSLTLQGTVISYGLLLGLLLIMFIFLITLFYIHMSNTYFEPLIKKMKS
jgi:uncharacterized membrane protein (DUF485 family)